MSIFARACSHWRPRFFADPAGRCIFFARYEASSFSRNEVTVNHLLLGILRQQPALVPETAREPMVRAIEAEEPRGRCLPGDRAGEIELGEQAVHVVTAATARARGAGRRKMTPSDLAAAILGEPHTLASRLLREHAAPRP